MDRLYSELDNRLQKATEKPDIYMYVKNFSFFQFIWDIEAAFI